MGMSKSHRLVKLVTLMMVFSLVLSQSLAMSEPGKGGTPIKPKAVLIVGPVDPPKNVQTSAMILEAIEVAKGLREHGVRVITLFHPNATWKNVKRYSQGANIFMYWGHGFNESANPTGSADDAYGIVLSSQDLNDYVLVSRDELRSEITLAPHSAVILSHTCYAAGDNQSERYINASKARRYVINYSKTFLAMGAEAYFASNFSGSSQEYINNIFYGSNDMKEIFSSTNVFNETNLIDSRYPTTGYRLMLDPVHDQDQKYIFSQAFAGKPDLKARDVLMPKEAQVPGY